MCCENPIKCLLAAAPKGIPPHSLNHPPPPPHSDYAKKNLIKTRGEEARNEVGVVVGGAITFPFVAAVEV